MTDAETTTRTETAQGTGEGSTPPRDGGGIDRDDADLAAYRLEAAQMLLAELDEAQLAAQFAYCLTPRKGHDERAGRSLTEAARLYGEAVDCLIASARELLEA